MITIINPEVNHCTCMKCSTQFFFDKEDILKGENFSYVICPKCGLKMNRGWNAKYFSYKERI